MATDEHIPVISDAENARKSDGTSTAGEHNVDKITDTKIDEQLNKKSLTEEDNKFEDKIKKDNNKRETDDTEKVENKTNDSKEDNDYEKYDEIIESTIIINNKMKIIDPITDENDEINSQIPKEELTVV